MRMSLRPKKPEPASSHLTIKEFTGMIQANESGRARPLTDAELVRLLEQRGFSVTKR